MKHLLTLNVWSVSQSPADNALHFRAVFTLKNERKYLTIPPTVCVWGTLPAGYKFSRALASAGGAPLIDTVVSTAVSAGGFLGVSRGGRS